jgi:hypothetical protein
MKFYYYYYYFYFLVFFGNLFLMDYEKIGKIIQIYTKHKDIKSYPVLYEGFVCVSYVNINFNEETKKLGNSVFYNVLPEFFKMKYRLDGDVAIVDGVGNKEFTLNQNDERCFAKFFFNISKNNPGKIKLKNPNGIDCNSKFSFGQFKLTGTMLEQQGVVWDVFLCIPIEKNDIGAFGFLCQKIFTDNNYNYIKNIKVNIVPLHQVEKLQYTNFYKKAIEIFNKVYLLKTRLSSNNVDFFCYGKNGEHPVVFSDLKNNDECKDKNNNNQIKIYDQFNDQNKIQQQQQNYCQKKEQNNNFKFKIENIQLQQGKTTQSFQVQNENQCQDSDSSEGENYYSKYLKYKKKNAKLKQEYWDFHRNFQNQNKVFQDQCNELAVLNSKFECQYLINGDLQKEIWHLVEEFKKKDEENKNLKEYIKQCFGNNDQLEINNISQKKQ